MTTFRRMASFKSADDLRSHLAGLGVDLPFDETLDGTLAQPLRWAGGSVGNRFAILPMEGWDGTADGKPSDLTRRRWRRFGESGAKLIWGGEAVAVRHDGRANPNQLVATDENVGDLVTLREELEHAHRLAFGRTDDLLVGLQLTHSGRFARPNDKSRLEPSVLYRHPILDERYQLPAEHELLRDEDISRLIDDFIAAAIRAQRAGYAFVDVKHCHGYLGHEFLSAVTRPGRFGGSFENRTRFLREIVEGIKATVPSLAVGVRVSIIDFRPFRPGEGRVGEPAPLPEGGYPFAFGADQATGMTTDLAEPTAFVQLLHDLGVQLVCTTVGSPYYNPHFQRPATFPPSDGYLPPEDPLVGVARQVNVTAQLKEKFPDMLFVGSGYTYLQDWLPLVGQAQVRLGRVDSVGLGRMVLSYPDLPADVVAGRPLQRKRICRTFSDCTTAPRNGLVSGCYPLDGFYKERPEMVELTRIKQEG